MKKVILLFITLLCVAALALSGMQILYLFNDVQNQINDIQSQIDNVQIQINDIELDFEHLQKELEQCRNDISNISYDDEISKIYNEINNLYKLNEERCESQIEESDDAANTGVEKKTSVNTSSDNNSSNGIHSGMHDLYYGRLYIPSANIDVALYYGDAQYITDKSDSANIFDICGYRGFIVSDHNNQEFSNLHKVAVGTTGYIETYDEGIIYIECVNALNGYNTGFTLVDKNADIVMGQADYTMYTYRDTWQNVFICLWDVVSVH